MLEDLDKVDWANIGVHVYSSRPQTEIPEIIRQVLSQDHEVRRRALGFLFGQQQDTGDIHDTTPYIIPSIIEILNIQSVFGQADILKCLVDISGLHIHTGDRGELSVHERRIQIQTYDALKAGSSVYVTLLGSNEADVRKRAAKLLGSMSDDPQEIVPKLIDSFNDETDVEVKSVLVEAVGRLLSKTDFRQAELRAYYSIWFRGLVETNPAKEIREAAARGSIISARESLWNHRLGDEDLSPQVGTILVQAYLAVPNDDMQLYRRRQFIELLSRLESAEFLLSLLEYPETTSREAQIIVLGLFWNIFYLGISADVYWRRISNNLVFRPENDYSMYSMYDINKGYQGRPTSPILKRILAVDRIWQQPTNLFSFFYGLPDSRDELHALIEKR